jgi:hypothetical protein
MKLVKISLVFAFVGCISWFVLKSTETVVPPINTVEDVKDYVSYRDKIQEEINKFKPLPDTVFYKDVYLNIKDKIDSYYNPHPPQYPYGRFGKTQNDNDLFYDIFSKNLFTIYSDKFIKQSFFVFSKPVWSIQDVVFIREEIKELQNSQLLVGSVKDTLISLQQILGKYYEINNFLANRTSLLLPEDRNSLNSEFPFNDLSSIISNIDSYSSNNLGNSYVNNNRQLHSKLSRKKKKLINIYLKYLETKLNNWEGNFKEFPNFNTYTDIAYKPLKKQIVDFKNNCKKNNYNYDTNRYKALLPKLEAESSIAYFYFKSRSNSSSQIKLKSNE